MQQLLKHVPDGGVKSQGCFQPSVPTFVSLNPWLVTFFTCWLVSGIEEIPQQPVSKRFLLMGFPCRTTKGVLSAVYR